MFAEALGFIPCHAAYTTNGDEKYPIAGGFLSSSRVKCVLLYYSHAHGQILHLRSLDRGKVRTHGGAVTFHLLFGPTAPFFLTAH